MEDVQAEVDRVKWGFEWTDAKLLDNLNAVRRYLIKKYPDNAISLEIDNDQKRMIFDGISRFVDFDALSQKSQHISTHHPCKNGITVLY